MKKSIDNIKTDYHLFTDIQIAKYLRSKNKSEFSTIEEANRIMGKIIETYNQKIASDHLRLDNLNEAAKTSWFNSVEIDFEKAPDSNLLHKYSPKINKVTMDFINYYDNLFPFLPEGAIIYLIFAGPALEAYGYPIERFNKIIDGEEPTEIEKDLLEWAYDLAFSVSMAYLEKNEIKKEKFLAASLDVACEELDKKTALEVVAKIYANYEEDFAGLNNKNEKPKAKKRKRKK